MKKLAPLASLIVVCGGMASAQTLAITTTSLPAATTSSPYSTLLAATGGTQPYTWSATNLPPNFTITTSGILSGTPAANASGTFGITVTVTDAATHTASATLSLVVNAGFAIVTQNLPNASLGSAYSQTIQTSGGTPPVTFSLNPNTIFAQSNPPPGITLAAKTGVFSGTPTKVGTYTFGITAIDSANHQATATYTISVGTAPVFSTASPLPSGVAGTPYSTTIFASGGAPPYTFSIVGTAPAGLTLDPSGVLSGKPTATGTFTFTVQVTDSHQISAAMPYQVTFTAGPSVLQTSALAVNFSGLIGGDVPPAQSIAVFASNQGAVNYSVSVNGGAANLPAPPWLTVTPLQGVTPGRLTLSVNQGAMQAANLSAAIQISVPGNSSTTPITIAVTFSVFGGPPQLEVVPSILTFASRSQAPGIFSQVLILRNSGGSGTLPFTVTPPAAPWIKSISATSGTTALNSPTFVQVQINTTGFAVGHYREVINVAWLGGTIQVPVTLFVSDQGPILDLSLKGMRFPAEQGNGNSSLRRVNVINRGDPTSTVNWTASLLSGQTWLTLPVTTGTATVATPGSLELQPSSNAVSLPAGASYALVRVSDPLSLNSPQYLAAVLDDGPASAAPAPAFDPGGLVFTSSPGSTQPLTGQISVETSSASTVTMNAAAFTTDGANWLTVGPASGFVMTSTAASLTVTASPSVLTANGVYTGEVDVAIGTELRTFTVTLILTNLTPGGCAPTRLVVTPTGLTSNFSVPVAWGETLRVQVNNDCGATIQNADVVASFSNGDSPLTLLPDGSNGTYSATWAPGITMAQTNVTFRAASANVQTALQTTTARLIGDVIQNATQSSAPILAKNGTLNNLNPLIGGALSLGLVAQVFGSNLAAATGVTGVIPLPEVSNGASLIVGSLGVPLYYASPGQLTAQIPFELAPNRQYSIIASVNGALTLPDTVDVDFVSPGVAAFSDGSLIAQHADFTLADAQSPAHPGEILTMYLVGMGATQPSVSSGNAPPAVAPFAEPVAAPSVTIDNQTAQISFAGMTPFSVGLYQINFQVPSSARTGTPLNVVVTQGGVTANITTLTVAP